MFFVPHAENVFEYDKFDREMLLKFADNIDVKLGQFIARVCSSCSCVGPGEPLTWRATNYSDSRTLPQSLSDDSRNAYRAKSDQVARNSDRIWKIAFMSFYCRLGDIKGSADFEPR